MGFFVKSFKYLLRPNDAQESALNATTAGCCELYNAALQEKRDAHKKHGVNRSRSAQQADLVEIKALRPEYTAIHAQVLQDVIKRMHRAFDGFFRRVRAAASGRSVKPGYPRFKPRDRYDSFTFPQVSRSKKPMAGGGVVFKNGRVIVHGIPGPIKIVLHRPWQGTPKTATFKREGNRWHLILVCDDVPMEVREKTGRDVGIDVGLETFARFDDGTPIPNPRLHREAERDLIKAQKRMARRKRHSKRRRKARVLFAMLHRRVANARRDFHHKTARSLVRQFDRIGVEQLNVAGLASGRLAKSIHDVGWAQFLTILSHKAANAGGEVVKVDARGTSQDCSACGATVRKDLSVRIHDCPHCGFKTHRDTNAALNIRQRAFGTRPGSGRRGDVALCASQGAGDVRR